MQYSVTMNQTPLKTLGTHLRQGSLQARIERLIERLDLLFLPRHDFLFLFAFLIKSDRRLIIDLPLNYKIMLFSYYKIK